MFLLFVTFTILVSGTTVDFAKSYSPALSQGTIVYEQPTNITQLSDIPTHILIGAGVTAVAITIIVLYRVRK